MLKKKSSRLKKTQNRILMKMLHKKITGCSKRGSFREIYNFNYRNKASKFMS